MLNFTCRIRIRMLNTDPDPAWQFESGSAKLVIGYGSKRLDAFPYKKQEPVRYRYTAHSIRQPFWNEITWFRLVAVQGLSQHVLRGGGEGGGQNQVQVRANAGENGEETARAPAGLAAPARDPQTCLRYLPYCQSTAWWKDPTLCCGSGRIFCGSEM